MPSHKLNSEMTIQICPEGDLIAIYQPPVKFLLDLGCPVIHNTRAGWTADLSALGGPLLGPFPSHSEAHEAEIEWLTRDAMIHPRIVLGTN